MKLLTITNSQLQRARACVSAVNVEFPITVK